VRYLPRPISLTCPISETLIEDAFSELAGKARHDANACFGYFPGLSDAAGIDHDLPASRRLSAVWPCVAVDGHALSFNFVRLSLIKQQGPSPFHLDSDASTALTGALATIHHRLVWRLLVNLSPTSARTVCFLNVEPASLPLVATGGYVHCREPVPADSIETVSISPREKQRLHGLLFVANKVLHSGRDNACGHFVAAFGREENQ
jgi:hypothetical protein